MKVDVLTVGFLGTNCYVISDSSNKAVLIDPGADARSIIEFLSKNNLSLEAILITHTHFDHVGGLKKVAEKTGAVIYMRADEVNREYFTLSRDINDSDKITVGEMTFKIIATPGHTPDGMSFLAEDCLFSGDTLFYNNIGRYDLPGGDISVLTDSLKKIRDLPFEDLKIFPGHMQQTTLQHERLHNRFMK